MTVQQTCGTCGKEIFLQIGGTLFPRGAKTHVNIQSNPTTIYFCNVDCKNAWLNDQAKKIKDKIDGKKWSWH